MHDERCTFLCPGGEDARTGGGGVVGVACMRVPMCVVFCKLNFGREPKKEIPKNDTHWLVRAVCATMLRLNLGTSVGNRRPLYHFEESQVHERISISIATPEKQKLDVQKEVEEEKVEEEKVVRKKPTRAIYFNTLCYYYWNTKGGCMRSDCHFIHDENMPKDQDTKKKPCDGRVAEVKVFLRNIPPRMGKRDIALLLEPHVATSNTSTSSRRK